MYFQTISLRVVFKKCISHVFPLRVVFEKTVSQIFPDYFGEEKPEAEKLKEVEKSKRSPDVVAPATRSIAPKKVKLTQTQVTIAKRLGVPLELYAKKVAEEMRKE